MKRPSQLGGVDQAHPVRPVNRAARDASVRWAVRHAHELGDVRAMEVAQNALDDAFRPLYSPTIEDGLRRTSEADEGMRAMRHVLGLDDDRGRGREL
jgi:hypothetical protein